MSYPFGMNEKTYYMLIKDDIKSLSEEPDLKYLAYFTIDRFTIIKPEDIEKENYKDYIYDIKNITYNNKTGMFQYRNNGFVIDFSRLTDVLKSKYYEKELYSEDRYHKCHEKAIEIAPYIQNSKILTGYLCLGKNRLLHSVIEYGNFIIDFNINAVINKEQYLKLTKFEIVNELDIEKVISDKESRIFDVIWDNDIPLKIYLLYRDELIKDLENKKGKLF